MIYGYQADAPRAKAPADWYGAAVYGIYKINDYVSAAARVEYYRDDEGFTTGISPRRPTSASRARASTRRRSA